MYAIYIEFHALKCHQSNTIDNIIINYDDYFNCDRGHLI